MRSEVIFRTFSSTKLARQAAEAQSVQGMAECNAQRQESAGAVAPQGEIIDGAGREDGQIKRFNPMRFSGSWS